MAGSQIENTPGAVPATLRPPLADCNAARLTRAAPQAALATMLLLACARALIAADYEPPVPPGSDPGGVAVALIDTGVNYTLPQIAPRLARNAQGQLLGFDDHDGDRQPFDLQPGHPPEQGRHHGTIVASILLREAPQARLAPYRFKARDFRSFARIIEEIAQGPARIVSMSLGGYRRDDWDAFRDAAAAHAEILFVVSAGNDSRDIDAAPIYPVSFDLPNMLVVASTDAFGRLPPESNWGVDNVDISTPGERIEAIDHRGAQVRASGSSYAVPRIAALAARLKAKHPDWDTQALKDAILKLARPSPTERTPHTKHGWIANPALAGD